MPTLTPLDHKIWRIAWPAILSNISIPLLGLVDAAILGHLGDSRYLGAVAIGSTLLSFLYWGFSFLRMGTTGLVARATGAGNTQAATTILAQSAVLALSLALLVGLLHPLWLWLGFQLMAPQPELISLAQSYTTIRIFSAPAVLLTYAMVGWFIGRQDTRWPMFFVVTTNLVNIGLDFLFVVGMGMGSDGAALATVIAEYLGCALAIWAVWRQLRHQPMRSLLASLQDLQAYRTLLRSNRHLFIRTMCLLGSFAFFTAMGDNFGIQTLAANSLMLHLLMLGAYSMDGFAFAAEGLAGAALGGNRLPEFYRVVKRCAMWCGISAVLVSAGLAVAHPVIFALLTNITEVRVLMTQYLGWLVLLPLAAAPSYLLDGVFIGAAETRYMMTTMLFSALLVYLPLWYLTRSLGNDGLWLAFTLFNLARGVSLYYCYLQMSRRGGWLPAAAGPG
jgi:MATE family, multidrug efflux pump